MLTPADASALHRGRDLKRCVRAAGALRGLYDDTAISEATGVNRGAVAKWWEGAQMKPGTLERIAEATGLSVRELTEYVYYHGPLPRLPEQPMSGATGLLEGVLRDEEHLDDEAPDAPAPSPGLPLPDGGAGPKPPRHRV